MIKTLFFMALNSWEKAITPDPKKFEYSAGMAALLAALADLQRQSETIRQNGVRLRFGVPAQRGDE